LTTGSANDFKEDAEYRLVTQAAGIPEGWRGLDIGTASASKFAGAVSRANTILWNGPMGVFGAY
jgi:phosphoglycerate kinase